MSMNVFITGASSGIGAALAREFASRGATLGLMARRQEALDDLIKTLPNSDRHHSYACDVTDRRKLIELARQFDATVGGADIVIANAGISVGVKTQYFEDLEVMEKVYATNVFGMASTFHAFIEPMMQRKHGTLVGIGCAYFLGERWRIADPIAALVVALFIFKIAFDLIRSGLDELMERSLPAETEAEILRIITADPAIREPHNLRTRRIGASIAIEVHVRVDGEMTVRHSHELTVDIERRLRERFGAGTMIAVHVEPVK